MAEKDFHGDKELKMIHEYAIRLSPSCPPFGTPEFIERHGADYVRNPDGTPRLDEKGKPVRCLSYEQMRNAQAHGY